MPDKIPSKKILDFKKTVWSYYHAHKRSMPWREDTSLYSIVVSEIMLQQTQVSRVMPKFDSWMKRFPDWRSLAKAPVKKVLQEWSGLGYNRRALYLKHIAIAITGKGAECFFEQSEDAKGYNQRIYSEICA